MPKGDHKRVSNEIDAQGATSQNSLNNTMGTINGSLNTFMNNYNTGVGMDLNSYNEIMQGYRDFLGGTGAAGSFGSGYSPISATHVALNPKYMGAVDQSLAGYGQFADNGGFSDRDIANIRARAISPTRAVYSRAQQDIDRQRALQGGYSPNYTAAKAKMTRDLANEISDDNVNADASIAQMVQQGKLAGLAGLSGTGLGAAGLNLNADVANQEADMRAALSNAQNLIAARGQNLGALSGMTNLYGTHPGLAETFGNQVLAGQGQLLQGNGLQNQIAQMMINGRLAEAQVPGNYQAALGNINSTMATLSNAARMVYTAGAWGPSQGSQNMGMPQYSNPYGNLPGYGTPSNMVPTYGLQYTPGTQLGHG